MASLSVQRATNTVFSGRFMMTAGLGIVGYLVGTLATDWMRSNVVDIGMRGGDALYALVASALVIAVLPKKQSTPIATGMMISGAVALQEYNVI
jgi:hypothetical protein